MDKSFEIKGYINNVLKETGLEGADAFDKALLLNALGKLEAAEHSDEYKDVITGELEKLVENDNISIGENDLVNYMYGNACYSVGKNDIAVNIAKQTETQPRTESGYFTGAEGGRCLCTAFKALSFYMNYETKDGGKEHYNDIIAQYNAIYAECFKNAGEAAHDGDVKAVKALALFAAGAVDTLEVMDQALYEIFARIREMYKAAVSVLNDTIDNTDSQFVKAYICICSIERMPYEAYTDRKICIQG